jgi:hypothetical protein
MTHIAGEKRSKSVLLVYLILALIGSAAISAGEAFYLEDSNDSLSSGRYFSSIEYNVDWLTTNILTLRRARGYSNSPLRNKLLRIFTFAGIFSIALYLVGANLKIIKNDNVQIIKNLVLLKLRI